MANARKLKKQQIQTFQVNQHLKKKLRPPCPRSPLCTLNATILNSKEFRQRLLKIDRLFHARYKFLLIIEAQNIILLALCLCELCGHSLFNFR